MIGHRGIPRPVIVASAQHHLLAVIFEADQMDAAEFLNFLVIGVALESYKTEIVKVWQFRNGDLMRVGEAFFFEPADRL